MTAYNSIPVQKKRGFVQPNPEFDSNLNTIDAEWEKVDPRLEDTNKIIVLPPWQGGPNDKQAK